MNVLNKYFNKIYIISSYSTQNRLIDLIPFFAKENIDLEIVIGPKKKYFNPDYTKTHCSEGTQSHISATESIFLKESHLKSDTFCIMEDDVFFDSNYSEKLMNFFTELPSDWDIVNLGYHEYTSLKINPNKLYYKIDNQERICGAHIVGYKHHVVDHVKNVIGKCIYPWDWFLNDDVYPHFKTYVPTEHIVYGSSYRENENNKHLFYKKYASSVMSE